RAVAAADVPADHAHPQVYPAAAAAQAVLAAVGTRCDVVHLVEVLAGRRGHGLPFEGSRQRSPGSRRVTALPILAGFTQDRGGYAPAPSLINCQAAATCRSSVHGEPTASRSTYRPPTRVCVRYTWPVALTRRSSSSFGSS